LFSFLLAEEQGGEFAKIATPRQPGVGSGFELTVRLIGVDPQISEIDL
jgi:hypothetical protein